MKIVLTGSLGNIGKPLAETLVKKGHDITVITSNEARKPAIESFGAKTAVGSIFDENFLTKTFQGADIVYLMETMEAVGDMFDQDADFIGSITKIGENYKKAVENSGVKKVIHLSSVGAHTEKGIGILLFHHRVEQLLRQLPDEVSIKFIRPVSFYINMFSFIPAIKNQGAIISNYGGDRKEPWVSPRDIAVAVAEEIDLPFAGKTVRYVASDELSPNEIAKVLGKEIGIPNLVWKVISDNALLESWLSIGFNEQLAKGFVELQHNMGTGEIYEDFYKNKPIFGKVKLADFAKEFSEAYREE